VPVVILAGHRRKGDTERRLKIKKKKANPVRVPKEKDSNNGVK
jgi:hypothetical protein